MEKEEWRFTHSPNYEVSSLGRVRRSTPGQATYAGRISKESISTGGYPQVAIDGKSKNVHVLVAEAFLGYRESPIVIHHIDGDKRNNKVENLCYMVSQKEHLRTPVKARGELLDRCATIRLPLPLWRRLKLAVMDGKIVSIHQAVLDALVEYLDEVELALERETERRW